MEPKSEKPKDKKTEKTRGSKKKTKSRSTAATIFYAFLIVILSSFAYQTALNYKLSKSSLKYWGVSIGQWNNNENLRTMDRVFDRLNYTSVNGTSGDWNLMWSIEFPFWKETSDVFNPVFLPLKSDQLVNHIPGFNYITKKSFMNTINYDLSYILPSFKFPEMLENFNEFVELNPKKKILEKNSHYGGVKIVALKNVNYDTDTNFYQDFMDKPLLIDGRAFEIGVFVLVSSIDPLRVYRFDSEIELRFCHKPYHPFSEHIVDQYVVNDRHDHFHETPSMKKYFQKHRVSRKQAFEAYLTKKGYSTQHLQEQIDVAISEITLRNEVHLLAETAEFYNSSRNFFELVRFDFIVDDSLEVFLLEVNHNPELTPRVDRFDDAEINENLVYETIRLIGAETRHDLSSRYSLPSEDVQLTLNPVYCSTQTCVQNCHESKCKICSACASDEILGNIYQAYQEHTRRGGFKRVYPTTFDFQEDYINSLTPNNQAVAKWFKAKCNENNEWC